MRVCPVDKFVLVKKAEMPRYGKIAGSTLFNSRYTCGWIYKTKSDKFDVPQTVVFEQAYAIPFREREHRDSEIGDYFLVNEEYIIATLEE